MGEGKYADFTSALKDKRAIAAHVANHPGVIERHNAFLARLAAWWQENLPLVEALAPGAHSGHAGNVYALRRTLLASIADKFPSSSGRDPSANFAPDCSLEPTGRVDKRSASTTVPDSADALTLIRPYISILISTRVRIPD